MANMSETKAKEVLLMLSGGRDSFLSACCLIEQGYHVRMITFDNGCLSNVSVVEQVAQRIVDKYGEKRATFAGVHSVAGYLYRFQKDYLYRPISESCQLYPNLRPAQLPCLACRTAMYVEAIAYCKNHNIGYISEGARRTQKFFVELPEMIQRYKQLVENNGIELLLPVYALESDWERKLALADRGYIPKTFEPQCWLGCPLGNDLSDNEVESLAIYFDKNIAPVLQSYIDVRTNVTAIVGDCNYNEILR